MLYLLTSFRSAVPNRRWPRLLHTHSPTTLLRRLRLTVVEIEGKQVTKEHLYLGQEVNKTQSCLPDSFPLVHSQVWRRASTLLHPLSSGLITKGSGVDCCPL